VKRLVETRQVINPTVETNQTRLVATRPVIKLTAQIRNLQKTTSPKLKVKSWLLKRRSLKHLEQPLELLNEAVECQRWLKLSRKGSPRI